MVKLLGAAMTGISCGYFGFKTSASLKKRIKSLDDTITSLEMLESEIGFTAEKLEKAFMRVDRNGIFALAAAQLRDKGTAKAWTDAVNAKKRELCLTEADCGALETLGKSIGRTDIENQLRHIRYVKSAVTSLRDEARDDYNRLGKVYRSGGVLTGLMIIIILL